MTGEAGWGAGMTNGDKLWWGGSTGKANEVREVNEEDAVRDRIKSGREVKDNENADMAGVSSNG